MPRCIEVVLSAYSQRPDPATANIRNDYLYSIGVARGAWASINFSGLQKLDVVKALERVSCGPECHRRVFLGPVTPITERQNKMNPKKLLALIGLMFFIVTPVLAGGGHSSSSHGSSTHSSSGHASKSSSVKKTVHVSSYTTKSGKHVSSYNRRPPNSAPRK